MTDRELLELAAKAEGRTLKYMTQHIEGREPEEFIACWNPLTDDRDAFRLAVKLNMLEEGSRPFVELMWRLGTEVGPDDYAATRRAITRAAAEIGKAMP